MWETIGDIINPSKMKRETNIKKIIMNGKEYQENRNIANKMNEYFSSVGETLAEKFKTTNNYRKYVKKRILNSFFLSPVVVNETLKENAKLDDSKAGGDDNMKPGYDIMVSHIPLLIARPWGQHGAQLGLTGPRWATCWPHQPCYLGSLLNHTSIPTKC